jgi:heme-degrading monooxygenase HmoA
MLRPELEQVEGFVDNIRYKSLIREGWILSLSSWRDEKSLVRWRTRRRHHEVQQKGRDEILATTTCASARSLPTIRRKRGTPSRSRGSTRPNSGRERRSR